MPLLFSDEVVHVLLLCCLRAEIKLAPSALHHLNFPVVLIWKLLLNVFQLQICLLIHFSGLEAPPPHNTCLSILQINHGEIVTKTFGLFESLIDFESNAKKFFSLKDSHSAVGLSRIIK